MKTLSRLTRFTLGFALASVFALAANAPGALAATVTSVATGLWNDPATWDAGVPVSTDDVVIGAGTTVTINTTPITMTSLKVNGTLQYDATLRAITVTTNVSIAPGGILQTNTAGAQTGHTLSVGGNLTNDGTLDLSTSANTSGARLTFTGAGNATFGGAGATTNLRTLTINKGTSNANVLEITTASLTVQGTVTDGTAMAFVTITNGTLKISGTFTMASRTFASFSVPATGGFWLNNPNYTVSATAGSGTITGLLRMTQGTLNVGTAINNSLQFGNNAAVTIEGGAINVAGRFTVSAATNNLAYKQTGGVITVCTVGNNSTTLASFDLGQGVGPDVVMSGGTIILRNNSTTPVTPSTPPRDYRNQQGATALGITNTLLQFGDAGSGPAKAFQVEGLLPNVVVSNASAGHSVVFRPPTLFANSAGDVTINPGCTYDIGNNVYLERGTTITNDGTLKANGPSSRFVWFQAGGNVSYQGAGTAAGVVTSWETGAANLTMNSLSQLSVRRVIVFTGNVLNANKLTVGDGSATLNPIQIGNTTTATAAGAFDVAPTFNLGAGGEHLAYLRATTSRTTGVEVEPGRTAASLTYDDNDPSHTLTIAGGDLAVTGTTALTNGRVVTGGNTLVANGTVTRTAGYVDGFLQKPLTAGGPVVRTFEVGDAAAYSPVSVTFASVSGAGTLTGKATGGDHAQVASSGIDASKSVNRNWTLTNSGTAFTTADAEFHYAPGDIDAGADFSNFVVRKYDAPNWSVPATGARTATSTQATGLTSFSEFVIGEPVTHVIVASGGAGGSIAPAGATGVVNGTDQTFTIAADACYTIADVRVDGGSVGAVASYTFTNVQANHTIDATFSANPPHTIDATAGPGGSITPSGATPVSCGGEQAYVIAANACYHIADVVVDGASAGPLASYTFTDVHADHTISASFALDQFTVAVTTTGSGTVAKDPDQPTYDCGGTVNLHALPDAGWQFDGWSGDASGNANPLAVSVDGNKNITATFSQIVRTLAVTVVGGGHVTKSPDQATYFDGTTVQLTAAADAGWAFMGWTGDASGNTNPLDVTMDANKAITATFADVQPPSVHVLFPICNELILVGGDIKVVWDATDNDAIARVDLYVTRDNGATYTPLALDVPNTGTYVWAVPFPGTNTGVDPVFSAKILVRAYDHASNEGNDDSDCPFALYDATTATVVTKLESFPVDGGVQIKWALGNVRGVFQSIGLERADNEVGPWTSVTATITTEADQTVAVDNTAAAGHSYWYRLKATTAAGQQMTLGSVQGTAGAPHRFELRAAWPNPVTGAGMTTEFAVARTANITLAVLDLQGRTVETLAKGVYAPGRYQVKWDGRTDRGAVPAGVYFLRFTTPEKTFTSRLVVAE